MDDKKRNKILFYILCGMLGVALVMSIVLFAMTPKSASGPSSVSAADSVDTGGPGPESDSREPVQGDTDMEEPAGTGGEQKGDDDAEVDKDDDAPSVPPDPPVGREDGRMGVPAAYEDEYGSSYLSHWSDTLFVTVRQETTDADHPYLLTHVVVLDGSQLQLRTLGTSFNRGRSTLPGYAGEHGDFVLAINASEAVDNHSRIGDGLYVRDGEVLQEGPTTGNEMFVMSDGTLASPQAGLDAGLVPEGVMHSLVSSAPVLIRDGSAVTLTNPDDVGPKTAIAMKIPGEYYIVTASGGNYISGVSYAEIQDVFAGLGCTYAKALGYDADVSLVMDGTGINDPAANGSFRSLLDGLVFTD